MVVMSSDMFVVYMHTNLKYICIVILNMYEVTLLIILIRNFVLDLSTKSQL